MDPYMSRRAESDGVSGASDDRSPDDRAQLCGSDRLEACDLYDMLALR